MPTAKRRGFSAWLYDVYQVQALFLTVALRYRVAADGFDRATGDEIQVADWRQEWAAAAGELEQASGGDGYCDELIQLDRYTYHFLTPARGSRLRMLSDLWQRWGDRLTSVRSRDRDSIRLLHTEFDSAWQAAAWRPSTTADWLCLQHYDNPLSRAISRLGPQAVGYSMPAPGSYSRTTRARQLHERGDLWNRVLPRNECTARSSSGGHRPRSCRGRRPPRYLIERVLAEYDTFGTR